MARKKNETTAAPDPVPAVQLLGPELTLPPGTLDTTLNLNDLAGVLATNLRRTLRAELERQTAKVKEFAAPLEALDVRFKAAAQAQADNAAVNVKEARAGLYAAAQACVAALAAFNNAKSAVVVKTAPGCPADARKGAGCSVTVTWGVNDPGASYHSSTSFTHTEDNVETLPATPLMQQLVAEIDELTAAKNAAVKLASDVAAQLRRTDLDSECRTIVIERSMEQNPQTSAWLADLYGRLGLAVDNSSVRKQIEAR